MRRSISPSCLYDKYLCQGCGFKWPWSSTLPWIRPCSVPPQDVTTDPESSCEAMNLGTWQMSLRSISVPKLVILTFSLNSKPWEEKCGLFSILFPHDPAMATEGKTFGNLCYSTTGANIRDKDREFIQSHVPLSILSLCFVFFSFCDDFSTKGQKCKKPSETMPCLQVVQGVRVREIHVCLCAHVCSSLCVDSLSVVCVCQRVRRIWVGEGLMWCSKVSGPQRKTIKHEWQEQMAFFIVPWNANSENLCLMCGIIIYLFSPSCPSPC